MQNTIYLEINSLKSNTQIDTNKQNDELRHLFFKFIKKQCIELCSKYL